MSIFDAFSLLAEMVVDIDAEIGTAIATAERRPDAVRQISNTQSSATARLQGLHSSSSKEHFIQYKVNGLSELQKFLDDFPKKMEANILRGAMRAGMKPVQAEAKQQLSNHGDVVTGEMRDGLKISTRTQGGKVIARLRATGKHAFIAYWFEFTGTNAHWIKAKNGKALLIAGGHPVYSVWNKGFKPKAFLRPALDARAQEAVIAAGNYIKNRLTKEGLNAADIRVEGDE